MNIQLPTRFIRYMRPSYKPEKQRPRHPLTLNILIVPSELRACPRLEPDPPADVIRVIDNAAEGGGSHE